MAPAIVVGVGGACFAYYFGTRGQNRQIKNISFILHPRIISRCVSEKFNQKHFVVYVPNKSTETQCSIVQIKKAKFKKLFIECVTLHYALPEQFVTAGNGK